MALITKSLDQVRADVPIYKVTEQEPVRVNILVPPNVRRQWKAYGVQVDKTVTDMIIEAMAEYIEKRKP